MDGAGGRPVGDLDRPWLAPVGVALLLDIGVMLTAEPAPDAGADGGGEVAPAVVVGVGGRVRLELPAEFVEAQPAAANDAPTITATHPSHPA